MIDHSKLPCKVSEVAEMVGMSVSSIYRYIDQGFLEAEERNGVRYVTGGELPVTNHRWKSSISALLSEKLPSGTWGIGSGGLVEILHGGKR